MVTVELGKLACRGLEGHFGTDLTVGARKALLHYTYKLKAGRKPIAAPRFLGPAVAGQAKFDLTLDRDTEALLAQEARRLRIDARASWRPTRCSSTWPSSTSSASSPARPAEGPAGAGR